MSFCVLPHFVCCPPYVVSGSLTKTSKQKPFSTQEVNEVQFRWVWSIIQSRSSGQFIPLQFSSVQSDLDWISYIHIYSYIIYIWFSSDLFSPDQFYSVRSKSVQYNFRLLQSSTMQLNSEQISSAIQYESVQTRSDLFRTDQCRGSD